MSSTTNETTINEYRCVLCGKIHDGKDTKITAIGAVCCFCYSMYCRVKKLLESYYNRMLHEELTKLIDCYFYK
jgi:hypothetical protein